MAYDPATIPPVDQALRRGVFRAHIFRRPIPVTFRDVPYTAAQNEPSTQRRVEIAGYTQETADLEIMLALPCGTPAPVANSSDEISVGGKPYRITSVQGGFGDDCYQITLSLRRR